MIPKKVRPSQRPTRRLLLEVLESRQLLAGNVNSSPIAASAAVKQAVATTPPNIVLINVDDMRADELAFMPKVNRLLVSSGTTFQNNFTPTSLSSPSRQSLFTGLYAHNTGVLDNDGSLGDVNKENTSLLNNWLQDAGYRTGIFGKGPVQDRRDGLVVPVVPAGWDVTAVETHNPQHEPDGFYSFNDVRNGVEVSHGPNVYSTDVWSNDVQDFIRSSNSAQQPFFAYFAPNSSHKPTYVAPKYEGKLDGLAPYRPPSFNQVPNYVTNRIPLSSDRIAINDEARIVHLETLLSVDDAVGNIYTTLQNLKLLQNTVIIFTADNGYMWGEHSVSELKDYFYDESIKVPLVIRDGRLPLEQTTTQMAMNIDLAPTIAALAHIVPPKPVDGLDLGPLIAEKTTTLRTQIVLETKWSPIYPFAKEGYGNSGFGIRTDDWKYVEYDSGLKELFDLKNDPYELTNLANNPAYQSTQSTLSQKLQALRPSDQDGPIVSAVSISTEIESNGLPDWLIQCTADDTNHGNSQVRTPEAIIDNNATTGGGTVLGLVDGKFDSVREKFAGIVPLSQLVGLSAGTHKLRIHGRDLVGNWGPYVDNSFNLSAAPQVLGADGLPDSDGIVFGIEQIFRGKSTPNAIIQLVAVDEAGVPTALGITAADGSGNWVTAVATPLGVHYVFAMSQATAQDLPSFSASLRVHVLAYVDALHMLQVVGSAAADRIIVDRQLSGQVAITLGTTLIGTLSGANATRIQGLAGNDNLLVKGNLPATLLGGDGSDTLTGGSANDLLDGGQGTNWLHGGLGDDTYRFRDVPPDRLKAVEVATNYVFETANQGKDTLDFSPIAGAVNFNWNNTNVANYNYSRFNLLQVMKWGSPTANEFETIVGSAHNDTFAVPSFVRISAGLGSDQIKFVNPVLAKASTPLYSFLQSGGASNEVILISLSLDQGKWSVNTAIPNGITAANVTGNGTGTVIITATRAAINQTFSAQGLSVQLDAKATGSLHVYYNRYTIDGKTLLETDTLTAPIQ